MNGKAFDIRIDKESSSREVVIGNNWGVFHTHCHHLFHHLLIDLPPIRDDIVTETSRTLPQKSVFPEISLFKFISSTKRDAQNRIGWWTKHRNYVNQRCLFWHRIQIATIMKDTALLHLKFALHAQEGPRSSKLFIRKIQHSIYLLLSHWWATPKWLVGGNPE